MILIAKIDMACKQGRPVELRNGRKAYVVGNAENFFHQLDCSASPLCKYIGFSTSTDTEGRVAIMTWDDSGKFQGSLAHDARDIVGLWDEDTEDAASTGGVYVGQQVYDGLSKSELVNKAVKVLDLELNGYLDEYLSTNAPDTPKQ